MSIKEQNTAEKSKMSCDDIVYQPDAPRIAIIAEDQQLPLDEGVKKTGFYLIRSFMNKGAKVFVFTRYETL